MRLGHMPQQGRVRFGGFRMDRDELAAWITLDHHYLDRVADPDRPADQFVFVKAALVIPVDIEVGTELQLVDVGAGLLL